MAFVHGNKAQTECWKIEVQMKNTEMPFRPHHPHFILHHLCGIHKISLETHHMYYVVLWIESIHNLPHLHKMCTKWETRTRITYRNRNSYTEGRAREWERERKAQALDTCVSVDLTGSLNENAKHFIITTAAIHIYCLSLSFFPRHVLSHLLPAFRVYAVYWCCYFARLQCFSR